jgi:uncharacterized protein (DUF983 family)
MGLFGRKASPPEVIDLSEAPPKSPALEFGLPTPCPECGAHGYLDGIDMKRRIMVQHCRSCFAKWETSEADLAAR